MEIEQKESKEETLKRFGVYHVDGAEYNVYEDVFFKEIAKLEAENKALREALKEIRNIGSHSELKIEDPYAIVHFTEERWHQIDQLLTKNEG